MSPPSRRARLLLVDDDPFLLRAVGRLLTLHGYEIVAKGSGVDALELLAQDCEFDLVIFDMEMPPLHGPAFLEQALAQHPELRGRFVVASGNIDTASVRELTVAGACRAVSKMHLADQLEALLAQA